jgi:hypothetical protein
MFDSEGISDNCVDKACIYSSGAKTDGHLLYDTLFCKCTSLINFSRTNSLCSIGFLLNGVGKCLWYNGQPTLCLSSKLLLAIVALLDFSRSIGAVRPYPAQAAEFPTLSLC